MRSTAGRVTIRSGRRARAMTRLSGGDGADTFDTLSPRRPGPIPYRILRARQDRLDLAAFTDLRSPADLTLETPPDRLVIDLAGHGGGYGDPGRRGAGKPRRRGRHILHRRG